MGDGGGLVIGCKAQAGRIDTCHSSGRQSAQLIVAYALHQRTRKSGWQQVGCIWQPDL
jgi:hypothetical protein